MTVLPLAAALRLRVLAPVALCLAAAGAQAQTAEAPAAPAPAAAAATPAAVEAAPAVPAADAILIELNKLEPQADACRAYLVLNNPAGPDITDLKLDLILFNQEQVIERRIAVGLSPLLAGKTTVKLFDIQGQDCARIGSVLINEVMSCNSAEGAVPDCTKRIAPTSRVGAKLFK